MITLSNRHSFEFVAASGALGFDGKGWPWEQPLRWVGLLKPELFTIITKSISLKPKRGNLSLLSPWRSVRLCKGGAVNAVGLTNPGIDGWLKEIYPQIAKSPWSFVCSIVGEELQDYMELAAKLKNCTTLKGIEINASCPNSFGELQGNTQAVIDTAKAMKYMTDLPLILKLSYTHDYVAIAKAMEGTVEAVSINSVPWPVVYPDKKSPLTNLGGGGVSGKAVQKFTWKMAEELARETKVPVIGASVWDYDDIRKLFGLGVKAVAFGSIFLRYPWRPTRFIQRWNREHFQKTE